VGEFGLIARITDGLVMPPSVSVGPGDDAACFLVNGSCVVSTDMYVEGVHFRLDWSEPAEIGRKVVGASVADIEAMGAQPTMVLVALALPVNIAAGWSDAFTRGVRLECDKAAVTLVGGDVSRGPQVCVSVTAVGETSGVAPVTRAGARPGDLVACIGRLGWAAAGLGALTRGFRTPKDAVDAHRFPLVPYGAGRQAALAGATAMIDVSDGLLADLGHIADASGVVIDIDTQCLAIGDAVSAVARAGGIDPLDYVLTGGEDHALVATFAHGDVPMGWTIIGQASAGDPAVLVNGQAWAGNTGWRHF